MCSFFCCCRRRLELPNGILHHSNEKFITFIAPSLFIIDQTIAWTHMHGGAYECMMNVNICDCEQSMWSTNLRLLFYCIAYIDEYIKRFTAHGLYANEYKLTTENNEDIRSECMCGSGVEAKRCARKRVPRQLHLSLHASRQHSIRIDAKSSSQKLSARTLTTQSIDAAKR